MYVFLGVKDSRPSLVWVRERAACIHVDPHMLAVLLGATCASHETHNSCRSPQAPQLAASLSVTESFHRPFLSRFMVVKFPLKFKKTYGDLRSCRSSDETLEERLELYLQKRRTCRLFLYLRAHLTSRYNYCLDAFFCGCIPRRPSSVLRQRFHTRSSLAPRKTYT
jgi:hypothetical protein